MILANTLFQCVCYHPEEFQIITSGTDRKVRVGTFLVHEKSHVPRGHGCRLWSQATPVRRMGVPVILCVTLEMLCHFLGCLCFIVCKMDVTTPLTSWITVMLDFNQACFHIV